MNAGLPFRVRFTSALRDSGTVDDLTVDRKLSTSDFEVGLENQVLCAR